MYRFNSLIKILTEAIENISKTDPDRITGENREFLKLHLPKPEETKQGEEILINKKGSRKTYYTLNQKLFTYSH